MYKKYLLLVDFTSYDSLPIFSDLLVKVAIFILIRQNTIIYEDPIEITICFPTFATSKEK